MARNQESQDSTNKTFLFMQNIPNIFGQEKSSRLFCGRQKEKVGEAGFYKTKRPSKKSTVFSLVGVAGLEPTASWSRTKHATKLRYTPSYNKTQSDTRLGFVLVAARLGFEPRQTESESVVLPLHNRAIHVFVVDNVYYYTRFGKNVNGSRKLFCNFFARPQKAARSPSCSQFVPKKSAKTS